MVRLYKLVGTKNYIMTIEDTENADLDFDSKEYNTLKTGIVIFPENSDDVTKLKYIKKFLIMILK